MVWALLAAALLAIAWLIRNDGKSHARFKALAETRDRQRAVLRWARTAFLFWFAMPLAGLALLGRVQAIWTFPEEFASLALAEDARQGMAFALFYAGCLLGGAFLGVFIRRVILERKPSAAARVPDIVPIMPRNAAEARCVALLTLNAGIAEEIFFRLYLPLLIVLAGGGPLLAFAVAALLFGLLHRYQGWVGVIATTLLGLVFTLTYLLSFGLILPMVLHLALNATNVLLRPALRGWRQPDDKG